ncbi:hypothetical protein [aff. Roholtiella sp. LEGE 12411]|nr:hypothetical protein [aff. Roholtiella sp. LEGE 12411]
MYKGVACDGVPARRRRSLKLILEDSSTLIEGRTKTRRRIL